MDLEIMRFAVSTAFLLLLLWKSHRDGARLEERHYEAAMAFRTMPRIAEANVQSQVEILTQMRLLTAKMELIRESLEHIGAHVRGTKS